MHDLTKAQLAECREVNSLVMSRDHWGAVYEHVTFLIYYSVLRADDLAVDCGVNIGDHTRLMAQICRQGRVVSFEAAPKMLVRARSATAGMNNIRFVEKALWERGGEKKTFHFFPNEDGLSGFNFRDGVSGEEVFEVETVTLDEAVDGDPSLIKLDIEGAEYHALLGAERLMTQSKPVIVFENGRGEAAQRFGYGKDDFFSLFYDRGYALYSIAGMPFVPDLWEDMGCPWQFVAVHPASSRIGAALGVMHSFVSSLR